MAKLHKSKNSSNPVELTLHPRRYIKERLLYVLEKLDCGVLDNFESLAQLHRRQELATICWECAVLLAEQCHVERYTLIRQLKNSADDFKSHAIGSLRALDFRKLRESDMANWFDLLARIRRYLWSYEGFTGDYFDAGDGGPLQIVREAHEERFDVCVGPLIEMTHTPWPHVLDPRPRTKEGKRE